MPRLQTRDAGPTVDQWASLVPLRRTAPVLPYVFGDCATWWALARQCLIAFEPLHALGFVHLDFKADNVCVPWKPSQAARPAAGQPMAPDFDGLALIDVAFSLLPGVDLPGALPLAREPGFEYQSPRLLEALDEGRRGELRPTRELDWRCDFFSLAAMLWRMLPEIDDAAGTGWTRERHEWATQFVGQLLDVHGAPLPAARPHRTLIAEAALRLTDPQLVAALQSGSSFDPERAWPNGAEAMPLTRVAATPLARRGERIEPRFAMPTPATEPPASAAPTAAAPVDPATPATAPFAATAPPPVVDDEVAPTGAKVDLPLDVEIDVPLDVNVDVPLEAPVAHAIDIPVDVAAERTIDLDAEAAVTRATDAPFARTVDASAADRAEARRSEPVAASALAAAVAGTAPATAPMARAAAVEARTPMTIAEDAPTWRTLPEPSSWPAPLDDGEPRSFAPFDSTPPETAIGAAAARAGVVAVPDPRGSRCRRAHRRGRGVVAARRSRALRCRHRARGSAGAGCGERRGRSGATRESRHRERRVDGDRKQRRADDRARDNRGRCSGFDCRIGRDHVAGERCAGDRTRSHPCGGGHDRTGSARSECLCLDARPRARTRA